MRVVFSLFLLLFFAGCYEQHDTMSIDAATGDVTFRTDLTCLRDCNSFIPNVRSTVHNLNIVGWDIKIKRVDSKGALLLGKGNLYKVPNTSKFHETKRDENGETRLRFFVGDADSRKIDIIDTDTMEILLSIDPVNAADWYILKH